MGGLFSSSPPEPDPRIAESQLRQEKMMEKREQKESATESAEKRKVHARMKARRVGGMRLLLSPDRENAATGLRTTLGA